VQIISEVANNGKSRNFDRKNIARSY